MKRFINIITITLFILTILIINNKSVAQVPTVEGVEKEFKIVNTYINKSNNNIIEFNDNSYLVINHNKNIYEFYATECGDYGIKAQETKELTNIIKTYMINKYNMNESEIDKDNIFKNDILASEEQEGIQSNYTEEDYIKYLEYKNNLIDQYGEDIYKLMNQEAGITTEEESFKHFMEYGI